MTRTKASTPRTIGLPPSPTAVSATPKKTEKITIGRISLVAHRLEDRLRHEVRDEILEVERRRSRRRSRRWRAGSAGRARRPGWSAVTRISPRCQRHQARKDEPADRTQADPAERRDVAHVRNSGDQRREDERCDDHLDQPQEQGGDDAEIIGDRLQPLGARRSAVVDRVVRRPAGDDPEHQRDQDELRQSFGHGVPLCAADPSRTFNRRQALPSR